MPEFISRTGLTRANRLLAALVENPHDLDSARQRFSEPPPSYTSEGSTVYQCPDAPDAEEQRLAEREFQLRQEYTETFAWSQLQKQIKEEEAWLTEEWLAQEARSGRSGRFLSKDLDDKPFYEPAEENVKARWVEQGIWNDWEQGTVWRWKHEEPLEAESETGSDGAPQPSLFAAPSQSAAVESRQPKISAEALATREREREASRPYFQFLYQVSKARERLLAARDRLAQNERNGAEPTAAIPVDINSLAYELVKKTWIKWQIWTWEWGVLPGMSWKHEGLSAEEFALQRMTHNANIVQPGAPGNEEDNAAQVPPGSISAVSHPFAESTNLMASFHSYMEEEPGALTPASVSRIGEDMDSGADDTPIRASTNQESNDTGQAWRATWIFGGPPPEPINNTQTNHPLGDGENNTVQARRATGIFGDPPPEPTNNTQTSHPLEDGENNTVQARPATLFGNRTPEPTNNTQTSHQLRDGESNTVQARRATGIFGGPRPERTNRSSDLRNDSQQEPAARTISAAESDSDSDRAPRTRNHLSPLPVSAESNHNPKPPSTSRPQTPQTTRTTDLGPIHSNKVTKTRGKGKGVRGRQARTPGSERLGPSVREAAAAAPEAAASVTKPRRSRRLQDAQHIETSSGPSGDAAADPQERSRPQPRRGRASAAPKAPARQAKPQGVAKRRATRRGPSKKHSAD